MEINKSKYFTNFSLTMTNWMKITICRIGQYSNFFSNCCDKAHDRRSLRREGCVYLCSHFVGKACQQQHKVAGHIDFTIRKQREINAGAQLNFFCSVWEQNPWMFSPQLNVTENTLRAHSEMYVHGDPKPSQADNEGQQSYLA